VNVLRHKPSNKSKRRKDKSLGITFTLETLPGVIRFNNQLAHLLADAKTTRERAGAFNGIVNNQIHALVGRTAGTQGNQVNVNVATIDPEAIIVGYVNTLPPSLRNGIVAWEREQAKLEAQENPSTT
jgi:hypothetical protein